MKKSEIEGLVTMPSDFGPDETINRLEKEIQAQGMVMFARINHAALAVEAELKLQPTEVIIFGNPQAGTLLMQASQTIGIDLPLKALIWQDASSKTWLSYNEPAWLAKRHELGIENARIIETMALLLKTMAIKAAKS